MKVYFITRFSILDYNHKAWFISKLSKEEYAKKLFSKERLDFKFDAFGKMVLPSIFMPDSYKDRLKKMTATKDLLKSLGDEPPSLPRP